MTDFAWLLLTISFSLSSINFLEIDGIVILSYLTKTISDSDSLYITTYTTFLLGIFGILVTTISIVLSKKIKVKYTYFFKYLLYAEQGLNISIFNFFLNTITIVFFIFFDVALSYATIFFYICAIANLIQFFIFVVLGLSYTDNREKCTELFKRIIEEYSDSNEIITFYNTFVRTCFEFEYFEILEDVSKFVNKKTDIEYLDRIKRQKLIINLFSSDIESNSFKIDNDIDETCFTRIFDILAQKKQQALLEGSFDLHLFITEKYYKVCMSYFDNDKINHTYGRLIVKLGLTDFDYLRMLESHSNESNDYFDNLLKVCDADLSYASRILINLIYVDEKLFKQCMASFPTYIQFLNSNKTRGLCETYREYLLDIFTYMLHAVKHDRASLNILNIISEIFFDSLEKIKYNDTDRFVYIEEYSSTKMKKIQETRNYYILVLILFLNLQNEEEFNLEKLCNMLEYQTNIGTQPPDKKTGLFLLLSKSKDLLYNKLTKIFNVDENTFEKRKKMLVCKLESALEKENNKCLEQLENQLENDKDKIRAFLENEREKIENAFSVFSGDVQGSSQHFFLQGEIVGSYRNICGDQNLKCFGSDFFHFFKPYLLNLYARQATIIYIDSFSELKKFIVVDNTEGKEAEVQIFISIDSLDRLYREKNIDIGINFIKLGDTKFNFEFLRSVENGIICEKDFFNFFKFESVKLIGDFFETSRMTADLQVKQKFEIKLSYSSSDTKSVLYCLNT